MEGVGTVQASQHETRPFSPFLPKSAKKSCTAHTRRSAGVCTRDRRRPSGCSWVRKSTPKAQEPTWREGWVVQDGAVERCAPRGGLHRSEARSEPAARESAEHVQRKAQALASHATHHIHRHAPQRAVDLHLAALLRGTRQLPAQAANGARHDLAARLHDILRAEWVGRGGRAARILKRMCAASGSRPAAETQGAGWPTLRKKGCHALRVSFQASPF